MMRTEGPFVAMAVLCQRYDRQSDGTVDVTGIVDGLGLTAASPDDLISDPATLHLMALIALRAGAERGAHQVTVRGRFPSGTPGPSISQRVVFSDDRPGAALRVPLELALHESGTYWFDVEYDEALLTSISLLVDVRFTGASTS